MLAECYRIPDMPLGDRKFYVTGGRTENSHRDDRVTEPLVCYGKDRLDALTRSGITVWEAEEYEKVMADHPELDHRNRPRN